MVLFNTIKDILEYEQALKDLPKNLANELKETVIRERDFDFDEWSDIFTIFIDSNYDELIKIGYITEEVY